MAAHEGSRLASLGAIFYLVMDVAIDWGCSIICEKTWRPVEDF